MPVDEEKALAKRAAEKAEATAAIEAALAATATDRDGWQRDKLATAITWLFRAGYDAAICFAAQAVIPANQRMPMSDPATASHTSEALRRALDAAIAEPVRLHPSNGPINFV